MSISYQEAAKNIKSIAEGFCLGIAVNCETLEEYPIQEDERFGYFIMLKNGCELSTLSVGFREDFYTVS